jgi:hypothetical protein
VHFCSHLSQFSVSSKVNAGTTDCVAIEPLNATAEESLNNGSLKRKLF